MSNSTSRNLRRFAAVGAAALVSGSALAATATADGHKAPAPTAHASAVTVDKKLAAELPASVQSSKTINAAIDPSFPVNNYYASDGKTVIGLSPDLLKAVGQVLGVKIQITPIAIASIIPGLQDNRFDLAGMVLTDSTLREKDITLLDFQKAGQQFLVKKGNPGGISSLANTCGKPIAVEQGGTPVTLLQAQSKKCTAAGKPAVTISQYSTADQALLAVEEGRADATISDFTKTPYQVRTSKGVLQVAGKAFANTPAGWGIPKGSGLQKPLVGAIDKLIANGTYRKIFAKYGLSQAQLPRVEVNAAGK